MKPDTVVPIKSSPADIGKQNLTQMSPTWFRSCEDILGYPTESEPRNNFVERPMMIPQHNRNDSAEMPHPPPAARRQLPIAVRRRKSAVFGTNSSCECENCQSQEPVPQPLALCGLFLPLPTGVCNPLPSPPYHVDQLRGQFIPGPVVFSERHIKRSSSEMAVCPWPLCRALVAIQLYSHPASPGPILTPTGPSLPILFRPITAPDADEQKTVDAVAQDLGLENHHIDGCRFSASAPVYHEQTEDAEAQPDLADDNCSTCASRDHGADDCILYLDHDWSEAGEDDDQSEDGRAENVTPRSWEGGESDFWV